MIQKIAKISKIGLWKGGTYPFRVVALFWRSPQLWSYLIAPIIINLLLGSIFYTILTLFGWQEMGDLIANLTVWVKELTENLPNWLGFLDSLIITLALILRIVVIILLLILTSLIFLQLGVILGAPWYGKLSEALEKHCLGTVTNIEVGLIKDLGRAILFELKKLLLVVMVGVPLLLINLLPVVGSILSSLGGIILGGTIVCLDFFDSPLERRRLKFRSKLGFITENLPASATFSAICLLLISIPFLNLITIPICVASGTLFFCDLIVAQQNPPQDSKK